MDSNHKYLKRVVNITKNVNWICVKFKKKKPEKKKQINVKKNRNIKAVKLKARRKQKLSGFQSQHLQQNNKVIGENTAQKYTTKMKKLTSKNRQRFFQLK